MTEPKWTPEPWEVDQDRFDAEVGEYRLWSRECFYPDFGDPINKGIRQVGEVAIVRAGPESAANAARIVACVNYLAGISTENLRNSDRRKRAIINDEKCACALAGLNPEAVRGLVEAAQALDNNGTIREDGHMSVCSGLGNPERCCAKWVRLNKALAALRESGEETG